jgi:hypothetical protein
MRDRHQKGHLFHRLFLALISLSIIYGVLNVILFLIFSPLKTTWRGIKISFTTLDNPVKISLVLALFGLFFEYLDKRRLGLSDRWIKAAIFCAIFLAYLMSGVTTSFDSRWSVPTAKSIIKEGNADLNEYREIIDPGDYRVLNIRGRMYFRYPIGIPILAVPFVWIFNDAAIQSTYNDIERIIASFYMAAASLLIYLIAGLLTPNWKHSVLAVFLFAFCTSAWSTASRALWQHGPSMLMLTVALYLLLLARDRPSLAQYAGIFLAFSFAVRPLNMISILFLSVYVFSQYRKYFLRYILWSLVIAVPFFSYNLAVYHALFSRYDTSMRAGSFPNFLSALPGHLVSPSRGLFIYSPVLLVAIYGMFLKKRENQWERLDFFFLGIIFSHWILISLFPMWWGGHTYGPRYFSDMIPYFTYFTVPFIVTLFGSGTRKKVVPFTCFFLLLAISFFVHCRGATTQAVYRWNFDPIDIDQKPDRVWDWKDIQFLRSSPAVQSISVFRISLARPMNSGFSRASAIVPSKKPSLFLQS